MNGGYSTLQAGGGGGVGSIATMRERVLRWDDKASRRVYDMSYARWRPLLLLLELSGHGLLWLLVPGMWYIFAPARGMTPSVAAMLLNYLALAAVDLAAIGVLKPLVRRPRPAHNAGIAAVTIHAIDQYSFPSGHATRAALNAAYIAYLQRLHPNTLYEVMQGPLFLALAAIWAAAVAVSRVALGRHHVIDVAVGLLLGVLYVAVWHHFWINAATADTVRRFLRSLIGLSTT